MIKREVALLLLLLFVIAGYGQDRIITLKGDTIECRILRQGSASIYFEQLTGGVPTTSRVARRDVGSIILSVSGEEKGDESYRPGRLDLSFSGGPSYLIAGTKDAKAEAVRLGLSRAQADSYYRQLKWGWSGSADAHWLFSSGTGAGIKYRFFTTTAEEWATFEPGDGLNLFYGRMRETIYINYAAPSLKSSLPIGGSRKLLLSSAVSMGWMFYRNEAAGLNSYYLITGNNFGSSYEAGLDYFVTPRVALGVRLSLFGSGMREIEIDYGSGPQRVELPKEKRENVSALDMVGGIRIIL